MNQIVDIKELIGHTIERIDTLQSSDKLVLFVKQGYCVLDVTFEGDDCDVSKIQAQLYPLEDYELLDLGLMSQEEFNNIQKESTLEKKKRSRKKYKEYLRLKKLLELGI